MNEDVKDKRCGNCKNCVTTICRGHDLCTIYVQRVNKNNKACIKWLVKDK